MEERMDKPVVQETPKVDKVVKTKVQPKRVSRHKVKIKSNHFNKEA